MIVLSEMVGIHPSISHAKASKIHFQNNIQQSQPSKHTTPREHVYSKGLYKPFVIHISKSI